MGVQVSRVCDGGKGQSLQPFPSHARVGQLCLRYDGVIENVSLWYTVSKVGILMVALCQVIGYPVLISILHRADQTTGDARPTSRGRASGRVPGEGLPMYSTERPNLVTSDRQGFSSNPSVEWGWSVGQNSATQELEDPQRTHYSR